MEIYVGLDVSLKETSICVVSNVSAYGNKVQCEGTVTSEPVAHCRVYQDKGGRREAHWP